MKREEAEFVKIYKKMKEEAFKDVEKGISIEEEKGVDNERPLRKKVLMTLRQKKCLLKKQVDMGVKTGNKDHDQILKHGAGKETCGEQLLNKRKFRLMTEEINDSNVGTKSLPGRKRRKVVKSAKEEKSRKRGGKDLSKEVWYPLNNRCSPRKLVSTIKCLTKEQREMVKSMGFGKFLKFNLQGIPQKLGHFVLDNFSKSSMEIHVRGGSIKIDEEAISNLTGLPNNGVRLDTINPTQNLCEKVKEWRDRYIVDFITPKDIEDQITLFDLLYLDGVDCNVMKVDRSIPTMMFWDLEKMQHLEILEIRAGGLGKKTELARVIDNLIIENQNDILVKGLAKKYNKVFSDGKIDHEGGKDKHKETTKTVNETISHICSELGDTTRGLVDGEDDDAAVKERPQSGGNEEMSCSDDGSETSDCDEDEDDETDDGGAEETVTTQMMGVNDGMEVGAMTNRQWMDSIGAPPFSLNLTQEDTKTLAKNDVFMNAGGEERTMKDILKASKKNRSKNLVGHSFGGPIWGLGQSQEGGKDIGEHESNTRGMPKSPDKVFACGLENRGPPVEIFSSTGDVESAEVVNKNTNELIADVGNDVEPFGKRQVVVADDLKSPFFKRDVVIKCRYTKEEHAIWDMLNEDQKAVEEQIAKFNEVQNASSNSKLDVDALFVTSFGPGTGWTLLTSLIPGKNVQCEIIDCWAEILNHDEKKRSRDSPHRLFCRAFRVQGDKMWEDKDVDNSTRKKWFSKVMFQNVGKVESRRGMKCFDLVVFPILENSHYYLVVFELKNPGIYLIDNMHSDETVVACKDKKEFHQKDTGYKLKDLFVQYIDEWNHPKAGKLKVAKVGRLVLECASRGNVKDCGIYTMRHMETFMGYSREKFLCGLEKDVKKKRGGDGTKMKINSLRKKYAARILLSDINMRKEMVCMVTGIPK
ncbi:hypothetical protein SSX86_019116 [Deinandra increscens subsp. villosa]|uniref:Ubiquitin-like protease family profile domain-containing protein n=1 Tax=Deinandra increscens subsp. villosa TaxID=3103831 RepID=A0AAP0GVE7_9ASTR